MKWVRLSGAGVLSMALLGCGEGGSLAISAGAPATAVVRGTITECRIPIPGAEVVLLVQQDESGQARPVDIEIGPVTTDRHGEYLIEVAPAFAVPGPAFVRLLVTPPGGSEQELPGGTIDFDLGRPARDTARVDADLGLAEGACR